MNSFGHDNHIVKIWYCEPPDLIITPLIGRFRKMGSMLIKISKCALIIYATHSHIPNDSCVLPM